MTFSAQLFELLAAFGAPVYLSSYFSEDAGDCPPSDPFDILRLSAGESAQWKAHKNPDRLDHTDAS